MKRIPVVQNPKPHFEVLDGLKGIAALSVVTFHFMEWVYTDYRKISSRMAT